VSQPGFRFRGDLVRERAGDITQLVREEGNRFPEEKFYNRNAKTLPLPSVWPKKNPKNLVLVIDEGGPTSREEELSVRNQTSKNKLLDSNRIQDAPLESVETKRDQQEGGGGPILCTENQILAQEKGGTQYEGGETSPEQEKGSEEKDLDDHDEEGEQLITPVRHDWTPYEYIQHPSICPRYKTQMIPDNRV
jgi:hypothetical protein